MEAPASDPNERPFRPVDAATLVLGLFVAVVGMYAWLGPVRVPEGHLLALADPRLGADRFELRVTLDPRSGEATLEGLDVSAPREGDTFPVPYGPDRGRPVDITRVERSAAGVRIQTRCPTCGTVEWGRRDAVLEILATEGAVRPGMGYELHVRAGAGPLEIQVRSPIGEPWRHALEPLDAVALQDVDCPSEEGPCSFGPGFTLEDDEASVVRLRAREGSAGFEVRISGRASRFVAMRDRRSGVANAFFAAWLLLGAVVAVSSLVRVPSARARAAVLLAVGLSVPVALWVPGSSRWYWWPVGPVPMAPLLAVSSVVVSGGAAGLLSRGLGLPWAQARRAAVLGTAAVVGALALVVPALLIDRRTDTLVDIAPLDAGARLGYLSLYAATALGLLGGWLLGAARRDRATIVVDERRTMP